ncbi:uncharacterized protein LOC143443823 [Arvicanthis niloticus]|uniref:uncharacterized protein LOC143313909 n=1 Tax=Arvicanthis niloticus TaxID=61156 RepID=UPI00402B247D
MKRAFNADNFLCEKNKDSPCRGVCWEHREQSQKRLEEENDEVDFPATLRRRPQFKEESHVSILSGCLAFKPGGMNSTANQNLSQRNLQQLLRSGPCAGPVGQEEPYKGRDILKARLEEFQKTPIISTAV